MGAHGFHIRQQLDGGRDDILAHGVALGLDRAAAAMRLGHHVVEDGLRHFITRMAAFGQQAD
jgi:hypothetical protein